MIWYRFSPFSPLPTLKLCHTPPNQFDPVFLEETISNAGFVQSILYELLYVNVFNVYDAMDAADYMLNGYFEGKIHSKIIYVDIKITLSLYYRWQTGALDESGIQWICHRSFGKSPNPFSLQGTEFYDYDNRWF